MKRTVATFLFLIGLGVNGNAEASAWIQPKRVLWWKLGGSRFSTDRRFANNRLDSAKVFPSGMPVRSGDRIPFDFQTGGHYRVATVVLELAYGLTDRVELSAKAPWHFSKFTNANDEVEPGAGIGDLRLALALKAWAKGPWITSALLELKLPSGNLPRSIYQQPLGEGQTDWTLWLRGGRSLWPLGWLSVEGGYRWRGENLNIGVDPGNERLFGLEAGWDLSDRVALKAKFRGLWGDQWLDTTFGTKQEIGRRRSINVGPSILFDLNPRITLEMGADVSLSGEDLPAGILWHLSLMGTTRPN